MAPINKALGVGYDYRLEAFNNISYTTGTEPHYQPHATEKHQIVTLDSCTIISNIKSHTPC
jgi:hypothetical protein